MPSPRQVYEQIERLTSELIGLSLCAHQHFPAMRTLGKGLTEIGLMGRGVQNVALRNVPYYEVYEQIESTGDYNLKLLDGAMLQMMYRFRNDMIDSHRLAYFPSPNLQEFQSDPDLYETDEIYAEVMMRSVVVFPLRFDFDNQAAVELVHPRSHLTLGQYRDCRIPVSAPVTPCQFIHFILRHFYSRAFAGCERSLLNSDDRFPDSITLGERRLPHVSLVSA